MPIHFTVELIDAAAIRAFNAAVGSNRQKYARMAVPGLVRGAAAMQGQVGRGDDDGGLGLVGHGSCPYWKLAWWPAHLAAVEPLRLHTVYLVYCRATLCLMMEMYSELTKTSTALSRLAVTCVLSAARRLVLIFVNPLYLTGLLLQPT